MGFLGLTTLHMGREARMDGGRAEGVLGPVDLGYTDQTRSSLDGVEKCGVE
jgi:hypothetical protein